MFLFNLVCFYIFHLDFFILLFSVRYIQAFLPFFYLRLSLIPFYLFSFFVGLENEMKERGNPSVSFSEKKEKNYWSWRSWTVANSGADGLQTPAARPPTHTRTAGHTNWTRRGGRLFSNIIMVVRLLLLLSPLSLSQCFSS